MSVIARYTDFRAIFADGGFDPMGPVASDGMAPWPADFLRLNAIPEIVLSEDTPTLATLSLRLTINAEAVSTGTFDWYVSQRTDDPARQWFTVYQYSAIRDGTIVLDISTVGMAELGLDSVIDAVTDEQAAAAVKYVDVYCRRRSDGAIQRRLMSTFLL